MSQPSWTALRAAHGRDPTTPRSKVVSTRRTATPSRPTTCPVNASTLTTPLTSPQTIRNRNQAVGVGASDINSPPHNNKPPTTNTVPASDLRKVLAERAASSTVVHHSTLNPSNNINGVVGATIVSPIESTVTITPTRPHHTSPSARRPTPSSTIASSLRLSFPPSTQNDVRKRIEFIQHECEEVRNNVRLRQAKIETSIASVNASVSRLDGQADIEAVDSLLMDANRARRAFANSDIFGGGGIDGGDGEEEDIDVEELAHEEANKEARRIDRGGDTTTSNVTTTPSKTAVLVVTPPDNNNNTDGDPTTIAEVQMPSSGDYTLLNSINKQKQAVAGQIIIDPVGEKKIKQLLDLSRMQGKEMERLREEAQEAKRLLSTKESKLSESEALVHHQRLKITSLNGTLRDGGGGGGSGAQGGSGNGKAGGTSTSAGGGSGGGNTRLPSLLTNAQQLSTIQRENAAVSQHHLSSSSAAIRLPPQEGAAAANANSAAALAAIAPVHVPMCVPGWLTSFSASYHNHPLLPLNGSGRNGDAGGGGEGDDGLVEDDSLASDSSSDADDYYDDTPPNASSANFQRSSTFQTESDNEDTDGGANTNATKRKGSSFYPPLTNKEKGGGAGGGGGGVRNVSFSASTQLVKQESRFIASSSSDALQPSRSLSSIAANGTTTRLHRQYSRAELIQALYCDEVNGMIDSKSPSWGRYPGKHAIRRLYGYWQPHVALVESNARTNSNNVRDANTTPRGGGGSTVGDRSGSFAASSARSSRRGSQQRNNSSAPGTPSTTSAYVPGTGGGLAKGGNKNRRSSVASTKILEDTTNHTNNHNNLPKKASTWSVHEAPRMCFVVSGAMPFSDQIHALLPKTEVSAIWTILVRCLRTASYLTFKSLKARCRQILASSGSSKMSGGSSYKQRLSSVVAPAMGGEGSGDQKSTRPPNNSNRHQPSLQSIHDSAVFNDVDDGTDTHASIECAALLCCGGGIVSTADMDTLSFTVLHSTLEGATEYSKIFQTLLAVVGRAHQEAAEGMTVALPGTYADAAALQEHLLHLENIGRGSRIIISGFEPSLAVLSNLCVSTGPTSPSLGTTNASGSHQRLDATTSFNANPTTSPSTWSVYQTRKMKEYSRRRGSKSAGSTRRKKGGGAKAATSLLTSHTGDGDLPDPATAFPFRMNNTINNNNINSSPRANYKFDFKVTCVIDVAVKDGYDVIELTNHLSSASPDYMQDDDDPTNHQPDGPLTDPRLHTTALFPHTFSGVPVVSGGTLAISASLLRSVQDSYVAQITQEDPSLTSSTSFGALNTTMMTTSAGTSNNNTTNYMGVGIPSSSFEGKKYYSSLVGSTLISPLVLKWVRAVEALEEEEANFTQGNEKMRKKLASAKPKGVSLVHFQLARVSDTGAAPGPNSLPTPSNNRASLSATGLLGGGGGDGVSFGNFTPGRRGTTTLPHPSSSSTTLKMPPSGTWKTSISLIIPYPHTSHWAAMTTYNNSSINHVSSSTRDDEDGSRDMILPSSSHAFGGGSPGPMFLNKTGVFSDGDIDESGDIPPHGGKHPTMIMAEAEVVIPTHEVCVGLESTDWVQRLQSKPTTSLVVKPIAPSQAPQRLLDILGLTPPPHQCTGPAPNHHQERRNTSPSTGSTSVRHHHVHPQATFGIVTVALNLPMHLRSLLSDSTTRTIINLVELHMDRLAETYFGPKVAVSEQASDNAFGATSRGSYVVAVCDRYEGQWMLLVRGGNSKEADSSSSSPSASAAATLACRLVRFSTVLQEALLKFSYWPLELFSRDQSAIEKRVLVGDGSTTRVLYRGPRVKIGVDMVMDNHPLSSSSPTSTSTSSGGRRIPPWLSWDYLSNKLIFHSICASGAANNRTAAAAGNVGSASPFAPSNLSFQDRFGSPQDDGSLSPGDTASPSSPPHSPVSGVAIRPLSQAFVDGLTPSVRGYVAAVGLSPLQSDRMKPAKHVVPDSPLCWSVRLCGVAKGGQVLLSHTVALQATLENEHATLLQSTKITSTPSSSLPQVGAASISLLSSPLDGILLGPCGIALVSNAAQICSAAREDTSRQLRKMLLAQKDGNSGNGSPRGVGGGGSRTLSPRNASVVSGLPDASVSSSSPTGTSGGGTSASPDFSQPTLTQHDVPKVSSLVLKESSTLLTGATSSFSIIEEVGSGGGSVSPHHLLQYEMIKDASYGPDIAIGAFAAQLAPLALRSAEEIEFGEFQTAYGDLLHAGVISTNLFKYPFVSSSDLDKEIDKQMEQERLTKRKNSSTFQYSADFTPPAQSGVGNTGGVGSGGDIAPHIRTHAIETVVSTLIGTPDGVPTAASQSAVGDRLSGHLWSTVREGVDAADLPGGRSTASSSGKGPVNRDGALFHSAENSDLGCCGQLHPHCGVAVFSFVDQKAASIAVQNSMKSPDQPPISPTLGTANRRSSISVSSGAFNGNNTMPSNQGEAHNVVHHAKTTRFILETMCSALQMFGGYFVAVENHTPVPGSRVWDAPVAVFPTPNHAAQCSLYIMELARLATSREAEDAIQVTTRGKGSGGGGNSPTAASSVGNGVGKGGPMVTSHVFQVRATIHVLTSATQDQVGVYDHLIFQRFKPTSSTGNRSATISWAAVGPEFARVVSIASCVGVDGWTVVTDEAKKVIDHFNTNASFSASEFVGGGQNNITDVDRGLDLTTNDSMAVTAVSGGVSTPTNVYITLPGSGYQLSSMAPRGGGGAGGSTPSATLRSSDAPSCGSDYLWCMFPNTKSTNISLVSLPSPLQDGGNNAVLSSTPQSPTTTTTATASSTLHPTASGTASPSSLWTAANSGSSGSAAAIAIVPTSSKLTIWVVGPSRVGLASEVGVQLTPTATPSSAAALSRAFLYQLRATNALRLVRDGKGVVGTPRLTAASAASPAGSPYSPSLRGGGTMSPLAMSPGARSLVSPRSRGGNSASPAGSPRSQAGGGLSKAPVGGGQLTTINTLRQQSFEYNDLLAAIPKEIATFTPMQQQLVAVEEMRLLIAKWRGVGSTSSTDAEALVSSPTMVRSGAPSSSTFAQPPSTAARTTSSNSTNSNNIANTTVARRALNGWPLPSPDTTFVYISPEGITHLRNQVPLHTAVHALRSVIQAVQSLLERGCAAQSLLPSGGGKSSGSSQYRSFGRLLYLEPETGCVLCVFEHPTPATMFACNLQELLLQGTTTTSSGGNNAFNGVGGDGISHTWSDEVLTSPAWTPITSQTLAESLEQPPPQDTTTTPTPASGAPSISATVPSSPFELPFSPSPPIPDATAINRPGSKHHNTPSPAVFRGLRIRVGIACGTVIATIDSHHRHFEAYRRLPLQYGENGGASSSAPSESMSQKEHTNVSMVYAGEPILTAMALAGVALGGEILVTQQVLRRSLHYYDSLYPYTTVNSAAASAPHPPPAARRASVVAGVASSSSSPPKAPSSRLNIGRSVPFVHTMVDVSSDISRLRMDTSAMRAPPSKSGTATAASPSSPSNAADNTTTTTTASTSSSPQMSGASVMGNVPIGTASCGQVASILPLRLESRGTYFAKVREDRRLTGSVVSRRLYDLEPVAPLVDSTTTTKSYNNTDYDGSTPTTTSTPSSPRALFYQYQCISTPHELEYTLVSGFVQDLLSIWRRMSYCLQEGRCYALLEHVRKVPPKDGVSYLQNRCMKIVDPRGCAANLRVPATRRRALQRLLTPSSTTTVTYQASSSDASDDENNAHIIRVLHSAALLAQDLHLPVASHYGHMLRLVTSPLSAEEQKKSLKSNALTSLLREASGGGFDPDNDASETDSDNDNNDDRASSKTATANGSSKSLVSKSSPPPQFDSVATSMSQHLTSQQFFDFSHGVAVVAIYFTKEMVAHINRFSQNAASSPRSTATVQHRLQTALLLPQHEDAQQQAALLAANESESPLTSLSHGRGATLPATSGGSSNNNVTSSTFSSRSHMELLLEASGLFAGKIAHVDSEEFEEELGAGEDPMGQDRKPTSGPYRDVHLEDSLSAVVVFHTANMAVRFVSFLMSSVYCSDCPVVAASSSSSTSSTRGSSSNGGDVNPSTSMAYLGGGVSSSYSPSVGRFGSSAAFNHQHNTTTTSGGGGGSDPPTVPFRSTCCAAIHFGTELEPSLRAGSTIREVTSGLCTILNQRRQRDVAGVVALSDELIRALPPTTFEGGSNVDVKTTMTPSSTSPFRVNTGGGREGSIFPNNGGGGGRATVEHTSMSWKPSYSALSTYRYLSTDTLHMAESGRKLTMRWAMPAWIGLSPLWREQRSHFRAAQQRQSFYEAVSRPTPSSFSPEYDDDNHNSNTINQDRQTDPWRLFPLSSRKVHDLYTRVLSREHGDFSPSNRVSHLLTKRLEVLRSKIHAAASKRRSGGQHHHTNNDDMGSNDEESSGGDSSMSSDEERWLGDSEDEQMVAKGGGRNGGVDDTTPTSLSSTTARLKQHKKTLVAEPERAYGAAPPPLPVPYEELSYRMQRLLRKSTRNAPHSQSSSSPLRGGGGGGGDLLASTGGGGSTYSLGSTVSSQPPSHHHHNQQPQLAAQMERTLTDMSTQHYRTMEALREERESEVISLRNRVLELEAHMLEMMAANNKKKR